MIVFVLVGELPSGSVVLEFDALYDQAALESGTVLCTVMVSELCNVTLGANVLRGRSPLVGGSESDINLPDQLSILTDPFCWTSGCPCQPLGDANCDGLISAIDVQILLNAWGGPYDPCPDFNRDGLVSALDVMMLISSWGPGDPCRRIFNPH